MCSREEAEQIAVKYRDFVLSPTPCGEIEATMRFLIEFAVDRREHYDRKTLARYIVEHSADADLRSEAQWYV